MEKKKLKIQCEHVFKVMKSYTHDD